MVKMENCCLPENSYRDLWQKIGRCHLSFLELEESNEKIYQRNKLEEYIHDFLCISEHYNKFSFHETSEVFELSAAYKKDYKAAMGFNAIQMYAGNLLAQPWRKEYRQLKTYSGFYKHQVEANLVGAEKMFEAMGYKSCGEGLLILDAPVCPDRVSAISMDCIIAYVECQISKAIWDEVCRTFKISWLEVLEFRKNHICSPEQCANALKCRHHQRQYQEHNVYQSVRCQSIPAPLVSPMVPTNHSFPPVSTHHHVGLPLQQDYMVNGGYPIYTVPYNCINNDYLYNVPVPVNNVYSGDVALIPVESNSNSSYDVVDTRTRTAKKLVETEYETTTEQKDSRLEEWDYVYKNLESQGYNKDLGERGDLLSPVISKQQKEIKKVKQTNLDEVVNNLSIYDRPLRVSDVPKKCQKVNEAAKLPPKEKPVEKKPKDEKSMKKKIISKVVAEVKEKWTCKACTFLNESAKCICEMCGKSKNVKDETPIEVGGAECSKCTLVNSKNMQQCEACGTNLEGSPTYI
ncbi:uncharacterized protein LOC130894818 [Diorhabda carinulata]|uniref:uncharacterized protein LOC130894818 n=1 Tax=Diorhabda carinulata TaxID=1163345 RepID=UPI0025A1AB31|nr:uncharacterized protein LOC130894818 [Diorhabda carinulata]